MPTSTRNQNEDTQMFEPEQGAMFRREGFDRPAIRRELANVQAIALDDLEIEREDKEFVDPRTMEMPFGPTGLGETGGSGIETIRMEGEEWPTFRYVDGFEYKSEEGVTDAAMQRRASLETFDFLADANFLKGVYDRDSNTQIRQGVIQWLKDGIPSERTLDCEDYDGDSGDEDYTEVPEKLIKYDAFSAISGDLLTRTDPNWDLMIGRQPALSRFNIPQSTNTGRQTYRDLINAGNAKGGVTSDLLLPDELRLNVLPEDSNISEDEELSIDLTTELGDDEVILIPDIEVMRNSWVRLTEMPTPETFGPYDLRGGREAVDYAWRYSHFFDPDARWPNLKDAIHIQNVSMLLN